MKDNKKTVQDMTVEDAMNVFKDMTPEQLMGTRHPRVADVNTNIESAIERMNGAK